MSNSEIFYEQNSAAFRAKYPQYNIPAANAVTDIHGVSIETAPGADDAYPAGLGIEKCFFVFLGIGDGRHLRQFFDKRPIRSTILVIEPNQDAVFAAFSKSELRDVIDSGCVAFFIGPEASEEFAGYLSANPDFNCSLPCYIVTLMGKEYSGLCAEMEHFIKSAINRTINEHNAISEKFFASYRGPRMKDVAEKYKSGKPLRLMFAIYGETVYLRYAMRDIMEAAGELGHATHAIRDGSGRCFTSAYLAREMGDFQPDILFTLGASGTSDFLKIINNLEQPHVLWFFDNPKLFVDEKDNPSMERPNVFVAALTTEFQSELKKMGLRREVPVIPLAVDEKLFTNIRPTPQQEARYGHDVSFIGNVNDPMDFFDKILRTPQAQSIAQSIAESMMPFLFNNIDGIHSSDEAALQYLNSVNPQLACDESILEATKTIAPFIYRAGHRLSFLRALSGYDLNIYGKGWNAFPEIGVQHGSIENGPELAALYAASRVTLHIHELTTAHPRVLECLASGGFILSRIIQQAPDDPASRFEFVPGEEIAVFDTREDLRTQLDYFINNPEARAAITRAGRERVLRDFTWRARMKYLLEVAFQQYF